MRADTRVVNIAPAISTPHTALSPNFSETAKTGIEDDIPSAKTTVCNIYNSANMHKDMNPQVSAISLKLIFLPSSEIITPPSSTSSPLYIIGFAIENGRV